MSQPISFATPDRTSEPATTSTRPTPPGARGHRGRAGTANPPTDPTARATGTSGPAGIAGLARLSAPAELSEPPADLAAPPPSASAVQPDQTALDGHHRSWRVLRTTASHPSPGRIKTGVPLRGVPRFDPRCVLDEDGLLRELARRGVPRVPRAHHAPAGLQTHDYIEGEPLSVSRPPGTRLTGRQLGQVIEVFGALATITPAGVALLHSCPPARRPRDTTGFLHGLLGFTRERVHQRHAPAFPGLFRALGVTPRVLERGGPLGGAAHRFTERPFCLLHADLHRDNLIVAASDGALWTIDWELALIGDPLYDLATHLHLMRYPRSQERILTTRWARTMEAVLPGAAAGLHRDLPQYLRYKRVQSVFTDVIRHAQAVRSATPEARATLVAAAGRDLSQVLHRAAAPLGLSRVPAPEQIEQIYAALPGRELALR